MNGDIEDLRTRVTRLEAELVQLRRTLKLLFTVLDTSTDKEPFLRLMISQQISEAQESAIYDLMNELDDQLAAGKEAMNHQEFCNRMYAILPQHRPHHLAESIIKCLARDGDWDRVYEHLRTSGMNLRDLREERGY
jgi:hypothetical protein